MTEQRPISEAFLNTPIAELGQFGLTLRTINELEDGEGVIFVRQLAEYDDADILRIANFGEKTLAELRSALSQLLAIS